MLLTRRTLVAGLALSGCVRLRAAQPALVFEAADGVPVSGRLYGSGSHAVILVPGGHGTGETWQLQAQRLAAAGLRVLAMDYRGLGGTTGVAQDSDKAHLDVRGAIRRLRAEGVETLSLVGASWGGRAAALAAMAEPAGTIERIVLLAHSPFDAPEALGGRKLFIVARDDRDGSSRARLDAIREQYERAAEPKRLVVLHGAAHAQFLFLTEQGEPLYAEIERFLLAN